MTETNAVVPTNQTNMKTYWDHTDQERSALTDTDVKLLLDIELMSNGVLKPVAPRLDEIPKSPLGERGRFFGVEFKGKYGSGESLGIVFKTAAQAQAFIDLSPMKSDYDYDVGSEFTYLVQLQEPKMVSEELYTQAQVKEFHSTLKQRKALSERNAKLSGDYNAAVTKADAVTDRVWADWYRCGNELSDMRSIVATYEQYLVLTKNDAQIALTFLNKLRTAKEIDQAREWFPDSIPLEECKAVPA